MSGNDGAPPAGAWRQGLRALHTWLGLPAGWILLVVFFMGSLSYYNQEITAWMQPEAHATPESATQDPTAHLRLALRKLAATAPHAVEWHVFLPTERTPSLRVAWREDANGGPPKTLRRAFLNSATGDEITVRETKGGGLLYLIHSRLFGLPAHVGRLLTGVSGCLLAPLIISGWFMRKHLLPKSTRRRATTTTGIGGIRRRHIFAGLATTPFLLTLAISAFTLVAVDIFPTALLPGYGGDGKKNFARAVTPRAISPSPAPGGASLDAPVPALEHILRQAPQPGFLIVYRPFQENSVVVVGECRGVPGTAQGNPRRFFFSAVTGAPHAAPSFTDASFVRAVWDGSMAVHMGRFASPPIRALLCALGLAATFVIYGGLRFWTLAHAGRLSRSRNGRLGLHLVKAMNMAIMGGMPAAVAVYLWSNRLLPTDFAERALRESHMFFATWGCCLLHALVSACSAGAWRRQLRFTGLALLCLPFLNAWTTGAPHAGAPSLLFACFDACAFLSGLAALGWAEKIREPKRSFPQKQHELIRDA